jgi:hypothetical protein
MIAVDFCETLIIIYHISSHYSVKDNNYKCPYKNLQYAVYINTCVSSVGIPQQKTVFLYFVDRASCNDSC